MEQEIRFCAVGSARAAFATCGSGPVLVFPSWWASHVEQDWGWDDFRAFVQRLARDHTVVRYDRLGTGLSDRDRPSGVPPVALEVATLGGAAVLGLAMWRRRSSQNLPVR